MKNVEERLLSLNSNKTEIAKIAEKSKQTVSNWCSRNSIAKDGAQKIANYYNVRLDWLIYGKGNKYETQTIKWQGEVSEPGKDCEFDGEIVEIPFFSDVSLSAGQGGFLQLETNGRSKQFVKSELKSLGVDISNAACATVHGDSMLPVLPDGSLVGVDMSDTSIKDGKMYAIDRGGMLYVKRLYKEPNNGLRISSLNKEEYPEEKLTHKEALNIRIIGRIFWYSALI